MEKPVEARVTDWLVYTCLVGLIPVIARVFVWTLSVTDVQPIAISDLVAFGLVLHSANINEISKFDETDARWKAVQNGGSIVFLVLYALILFTTTLTDQRINQKTLIDMTIFLSFVSFMLSLSILHRRRSKRLP